MASNSARPIARQDIEPRHAWTLVARVKRHPVTWRATSAGPHQHRRASVQVERGAQRRADFGELVEDGDVIHSKMAQRQCSGKTTGAGTDDGHLQLRGRRRAGRVRGGRGGQRIGGQYAAAASVTWIRLSQRVPTRTPSGKCSQRASTCPARHRRSARLMEERWCVEG